MRTLIQRKRTVNMTNKPTPVADSHKFGNRYSLEIFYENIVNILVDFKLGLNINQIGEKLGINRNTTSKYLKALEATNKIMSRKVGVAKLWYISSEKNTMRPGPNIIYVKIKENKYVEIVKSNKIYTETISEVLEALVGANLWDYYPFKQFKSSLEPIIEFYYNNLSESNNVISDKVNLISDDGNVELLISISGHKIEGSKNEFFLEYFDLTLKDTLEKELINTESFKTLMDMFKNNYISIQTEDYKVVQANNKVLNKFNNGKNLDHEDTYCFDLYHGRDKPCKECPVKEAISKNKLIEQDLKVEGIGICSYECYPISSKNGLKGYLLKFS